MEMTAEYNAPWTPASPSKSVGQTYPDHTPRAAGSIESIDDLLPKEILSLTIGGLKVLQALLDQMVKRSKRLMNSHMYAFPSIGWIARKVGRSARSVSSDIKVLVERGFIKRVRLPRSPLGTYKSNSYYLGIKSKNRQIKNQPTPQQVRNMLLNQSHYIHMQKVADYSTPAPFPTSSIQSNQTKTSSHLEWTESSVNDEKCSKIKESFGSFSLFVRNLVDKRLGFSLSDAAFENLKKNLLKE